MPEANPSCSLGQRPLPTTGYFLNLLRLHFSSANGHLHESFKSRLWNADPELCKLQIEEQSTWNPLNSGKRPAIVVKRNDWKDVKFSVNNASGQTFEGHTEYTKGFTGSHTFFCIAKEDAEVELLGTEVHRYLLHFASNIRQKLLLASFDVFGLGAPGNIREATDRRGAPVTVGYAWTETWVGVEHAPILKRVVFSGPHTVG